MSSKTILTFVLGAAAGSVATWFYMRHKMQQVFDEYIPEEDYEEEYDEMYEDPYEEKDEQWDRVEAAAKHIHNEPISIRDYAATRLGAQTPEEGDEDMDRPCVITPEEFSDLEYEGYSSETLTLYADGVLADYLDERIENIDDVVGLDSLNHFGEYEEDTVFVRNDHLMTAYEIQRDLRTYTEVVGE